MKRVTIASRESFVKVMMVFSILACPSVFLTCHKPAEPVDDSTINLDFQNTTGVARLQSSFTDILVASEGSVKKGDGYVVTLLIINPSSITLRDVKARFDYRKAADPVLCGDVNIRIFPGSSTKIECFISDLTDRELKSIDVSVNFEQISFH